MKISYYLVCFVLIADLISINSNNDTTPLFAQHSQSNNSTASSFLNSEENDPTLSDTNLKVEKLLEGLYLPTSISFLAENDFIVLQKNGTVSRVINDTLVDKPLLTIDVATGFYQGLLGSAIYRNANSNLTHVFLYYTESNANSDNNPDNSTDISYFVNGSGGELGNKLYSYELASDKLVHPKLLLSLPSTPGPENNGGHITVGPDNNLYLIIGNVMNPSDETKVQTLAQNFANGSSPDGRAGILRITQDGLPVINSTNGDIGIIGKEYPANLYYAYGIHNGFGLAFDPVTGYLWDSETGHYIYNDEINLVMPGFNSGFGVVQGMSTFFPNSPFSIVNFNGSGKYSDPEFTWVQKAVPTGLAFLNSNKLGPDYENDLFVGTFNAGIIYRFDLNEDRTQLELPSPLQTNILLSLESPGSNDIEFGSGFNGISSIAVSPDGYLYVVGVTNGAIYKISPK